MANDNKKSYKNAKNSQEKLMNATNSLEAKSANLDLNHGKKAETMGPNTQR